MNNSARCPVCGLQAKISAAPDGLLWHCPRCGEYELTNTANASLHNTPFKIPAAISGWIRFQNSQGTIPSIHSYSLDRLRTYKKPNFRERMERYLITVVSGKPNLSAIFNPLAEELIGASYSDDGGEAGLIYAYLKSTKLAFEDGSLQSRISAEGHMAADELRNRRSSSTQGFVAMWFDETMHSARDNGFVLAIDKAGYTAMVISQKEHVKKIDDEIIAEIRRSAFLVADFTGHRGGVYFEAGFATGLNLPVIWTCRHDHMDDLHFDVRQYNCIVWKDEKDLASQLQKRIEAILGRGPKALD
jgi:predicted RNA-binding Zn-ribbon protein involved in translation (DUF1610 family)